MLWLNIVDDVDSFILFLLLLCFNSKSSHRKVSLSLSLSLVVCLAVSLYRSLVFVQLVSHCSCPLYSQILWLFVFFFAFVEPVRPFVDFVHESYMSLLSDLFRLLFSLSTQAVPYFYSDNIKKILKINYVRSINQIFHPYTTCLLQ